MFDKKCDFHFDDDVKIANMTGKLIYCNYPKLSWIDQRYVFGIKINGFSTPIRLDINTKDIPLFFDSIGKYDFFRKQNMDESMWKQRVLRCADEISKLIEEGKKYR